MWLLKPTKCATCVGNLSTFQQKLFGANGDVATLMSQKSSLSRKLGSEVVGFLQTGQVFPHTPNRAQFAKTAKQLVEWGLKVDLGQAEEAYFHTRVIGPRQYESMVRLLTIFAEHLSIVSNQLVVQQDNAEPQMIARAREFPGQEKMVYEYFEKTPGALAELRAPIFEEKVIDYVLDQIKPVEKKVSREELFKAVEEATES